MENDIVVDTQDSGFVKEVATEVAKTVAVAGGVLVIAVAAGLAKDKIKEIRAARKAKKTQSA